MRIRRGGSRGLQDGAALVEVARFSVNFEAEVVLARLRAHGIPAVLFSADAQGWAPHLNLIQGARIMVRRDDIGRATSLLAERVEDDHAST